MSAAEVKPIDDLRANLGKMASQFKAVMPTQEHVDRFIRVVVTAAQQNTKLLEADRNSFYAACMKAAQDGLLPDGKEAVLNIYNENVGTHDKPEWKKIVQYQPMIEGMLKKLRLSDEIDGAPKIHVVRDGDEFTYELGDNERIVHKPALGKRGNVLGAYSIVKFTDGSVSREYMGIDEIMEVRARSKAKDSGPWRLGSKGEHPTEFGEMCRKTVFRRHSKRLPKSSDLDNVINSDNETFIPFKPAPAAGPALAAPAVDAGTATAGTQRPAALQAVVDAGGGNVIDGGTGKVEEKVAVEGDNKPPQDVL